MSHRTSGNTVTAFKAKVALEALIPPGDGGPVGRPKYEVHPGQIQAWKKDPCGGFASGVFGKGNC